MSKDRGRSLNFEDRILWSRVAGSVTPLPGRSVPAVPVPPAAAEEKTDLPSRKPSAAGPKPPAPKPTAPGGIDRATQRKIAKGRVPIEGKVDLHGLTQREAHDLLLSFLGRAHADGRRVVLVVTGKGASLGSEGVLRRAVPQWLATASFRGLVSGFQDASRGHGGSGALYVRLRRPKGSPE